MKLIDKINAVFNSELTSYRIGKETGISIALIAETRQGKHKAENMTVKNGEKIAELYDKGLTL